MISITRKCLIINEILHRKFENAKINNKGSYRITSTKIIINEKFIDNIDEKIINDFVNIPSGIPVLLMDALEEVDSDIWLKRMLVFEKHPEYKLLDLEERFVTHNLLRASKIEAAQEYRFQNALNFLNKYSGFRKMFCIKED